MTIKVIEKYKKWNKERKSIIIPIDVHEIVLQQNCSEGFNRFDIVVRYLAIEEYYGRNNIGYNLYLKMQQKRKTSETVDQIEERLRRFKKIILDWEINGYRNESEIICDSGLNLLDGSHRLALSLYFGTKIINCKVYAYTKEIEYGLDWFLANGFTDQEMNYMLDKWNEIKKQCKKNYACILWNSVSNKFDEITKELKWKCEVLDYKDFVFKEETYKRLVKGIYSIDDIEDWKVDKKIEAMKERENYNIRVISFQLDVPHYRIKKISKKFISRECENIKKIIRSRYKDEISNYIHDIIIHIADNYEQSDFIFNLLNTQLDISSFFKEIDNYSWMMIKGENNYMPDDFPVNFPFSKDIDIVCNREDYISICQYAISFFENKQKDIYHIEVINENERCKIRLELNGFLIIQLDISGYVEGMNKNYMESCILRRVKKNGVYCAKIEDEVLFRLLEIEKNPYKIWHKEFIRENMTCINKDNFKRAFQNYEEIEKIYLQICDMSEEV